MGRKLTVREDLGATLPVCLASRDRTSRSKLSRRSQPLLRVMRDGMYSRRDQTKQSHRLNMLTVFRTNKDLDPVPRHNRKWGVTSFLAYWISDAFKYNIEDSQVPKSRTDSIEARQHGNSLRASSQLVPHHQHQTQTLLSNTDNLQASRGESLLASLPWHSSSSPSSLHSTAQSA